MKKINSIIFLGFLTLLIPANVQAVIQSLNGQTGSTQTFSNDTNVGINSSSNIHSLIWNGLLPISRGGTGLASFPDGAFLFGNSTNPLGATYAPSFATINATSTNATSTFSGDVSIIGRLKVAGRTDFTYPPLEVNERGTIIGFDLVLPFLAGSMVFTDTFDLGAEWSKIYSPGVDLIGLQQGTQGFFAALDVSSLTDDRAYRFPDTGGHFGVATSTFGLLEVDQTFTGLNKFEASSNSTIYVGSSIKSGCIALGDSDGSGITYITANDGVLSATSTKPGICQ